MNPATALIVDDEPDIRELLALTLHRMEVECVQAPDLASAKRALSSHSIDFCLTDKRLPDGDGLELVRWMQADYAAVPVAVITAFGNVEAAVEALKQGAFDFVTKPVELDALRRLISTALSLRVPRPDTASRLLGDSPLIDDVRAMIAKLARSQAPVHISGESGTGKELIARLIHDTGPRAEHPFVAINCGAIPAELMESELFGHRKGSFTGAHTDKQGLIQSAEGGTLFLDEVADLPLSMQVKLLRVIQEKRVRPVGASEEAAVDIRLLSATHKDLRALIDAGEFREDLFYRIHVIDLHAPALRDHADDIPLLAHHIIAHLATKMGTPAPALSPDALAALKTHDFPGNVRELENILERALALHDGDAITADAITVRRSTHRARTQPLPTQLGDTEREAIIDALNATRHNKTAAAQRLGMTYRQLRYRIKKLNLD